MPVPTGWHFILATPVIQSTQKHRCYFVERKSVMNWSVRSLAIASLFVIAACSGGAPPVPISGAAPQGADSLHPSAFNEVLKANGIDVKKQACLGHTSGTTTITAKGHASGPYSGTFTLSGQWSFTKVGSVSIYTFAETFKIAGAHPITGTITTNGSPKLKITCKTFGPVTSSKDLVFHLGTATGPATTNRLANHSSLLEQMH